MKKTGEILKKSREEKGLSLHEIGLSLKINPKILRQIEDGEKDNLPAKTFLRGFVQSYAQFLKLDPNFIMTVFTEEMGTTKPKSVSIANPSDFKGDTLALSESDSDESSSIKPTHSAQVKSSTFELKNIAVGAVVVFLLLGLIVVRKVVEKYQKEASVDLTKVEDSIKSVETPQPPAPISAAQDASQNLAAQTNPQANPAAQSPGTPNARHGEQTNSASNPPVALPVNQNPAAANSQTKTQPSSQPPPSAPSNLSKSTNPTTPSTVNPQQIQTTSNSQPTNQNAANTAKIDKNNSKPPSTASNNEHTMQVSASTQSTSPNIVSSAPKEEQKEPKEPKRPKSVELIIEAFENVEIELIQASGKIEKIKLDTNQVQTINSTSGGRINISNGGAVNLTVNGKNLGVPGDFGKPKKVSF